MRIFALLLLFALSAAAYRSQSSNAAPVPTSTDNPLSQTENILFQTSDGGESWKDLSAGLPENFLVNTAFTQNGEIFLADRKGIVYHKGKQSSDTWEREVISGMFPDVGGIFQTEVVVNGIYPGRSQPYASVYDEGFFRRTAGTGQWTYMGAELPDKRVYALAESANGDIFVGGESGIYKTADDGKSWKHVFKESHVSHLAASGGVLLANSRQGLIRSTDAGENWECVLADKDAFYEMNGKQGDLVAVRVAGIVTCSTKAIPLQSSADMGQTWQPIYTGPTIFKGIYNYKKVGKYTFCCHKEGVSRSKDGGNSWELVRPAVKDLNNPMRYEVLDAGETAVAVLVFAGC